MRRPRSIKARLLRNVLVALTLAWIGTLVAGYLRTEETLNRQLDEQLKEIAESLSEQVVTDKATIEILQHETISGGHRSVEFQIWRDDQIVSYSSHAPKQSLAQGEGYSQNEVEDKKWRVYSSKHANSQIMVGQDLDIRKSLVQGMILSSLWPMVVALPMIGIILWFSVTVGLKPLSALASAIGRRSPNQLSKISLEDVPGEVTPVIQSLNHLFGVVQAALEREHQFADNAAHELRTPLAGIKAQVEAALRTQNESEKHEGLKSINQGIDRASQVVNQLLTLARMEPGNLRESFTSVDLNSVVMQVIAKLTPQALAKDIDLGLEASEQVSLMGDRTSLEVMLSNLIDNAIKFSPRSSRVDVKLRKQGDQATLTIEDQGTGIPPQDRERVFDRFVRLEGVRVEGSGIGLSVVKKVAELHNAKIRLGESEGQPGLKVDLVFGQIV